MTTTQRHHTPTISLTTDSLVAADGTIWSHAATLGTRFKGSEFTIDRATIENFVRVFTSGYPQKIPVDYEHGTTNGATTRGQPVPKAGDVLELRGVFAASDFAGELRTAAEKLAAKADRSLDDPKNFGLWMRWRPTKRALGMIQEGEYSELSIAFDEDFADNTTGKGQGPTLLAVALTNLPFLDDMLPVAASRDLGGSPAVIGQKEFTMSKVTMLAAAAALFGKPVVDEEQAVTELTALQTELPKLRSYAADVGAELGETDPAKAVEKVKQLKASVTQYESAAAEAKKAATKAVVDSTLKEHESKFVPAMRPMLERELTREITEGKAAKDTDVVKALSAAPKLGITERATGADDGSSSANTTDDVKLDAAAKELMQSDAEVKELYQSRGHSAAFSLALEKASAKLHLVKA
jgi:phage I-like protein